MFHSGLSLASWFAFALSIWVFRGGVAHGGGGDFHFVNHGSEGLGGGIAIANGGDLGFRLRPDGAQRGDLAQFSLGPGL